MPPRPADGVEVVGCRQPADIAPSAILAALAERGFNLILIEGGADTCRVSLPPDVSTGCTS